MIRSFCLLISVFCFYCLIDLVNDCVSYLFWVVHFGVLSVYEHKYRLWRLIGNNAIFLFSVCLAFNA